ncbi:RRQRL motif-containing zinc-binding protein [Saccharothrix obliqua]|uniref:RRQRL motif-containing zinc-binding protein n=1 Tax=Saccharothrix obliqua TaxID=2861747 RepID=UPI001C5EA5DA|nr:RRQRL motif-containing zinc-binding protein [Saccharothrix obliqua]MBW4717415.1 hypothetical protein [Saccharothrix obliqua]
MGRRSRVEFRTVVLPWNGMAVVSRGVRDGLPVFGWRGRPGAVPAGLYTRRQLRAKGLQPGTADPDALLVFRHRVPARTEEVCELWREEIAVPVRAMTPGMWRAHQAAMRARRFCQAHQGYVDHVVRGPRRLCSACFFADANESVGRAA